ncbi:MAG: hypothetical protein K2W93_17290, partial [Burkholderiaceae bacterium]|nr:hypothetical protein [Burkholderiaceae bacterium]
MAASAVASAQALSEITLVAQATANGQPQRQLAVNLRGDLVLLLQDRVEEGSRHQAIVALVQRQPGMLLDVPGALRQVDELALDCHGGTRTVWRSEAYRAGDPTAQPSRSLRLDPEQRRTDALADLALSNPLMAAALRTLCAGGGTVVRQAELTAPAVPAVPAVPAMPAVPPVPAVPATPEVPIEPGSAPPPSSTVPPVMQGPPAWPATPPPAQNNPSSWINAPIFPGS